MINESGIIKKVDEDGEEYYSKEINMKINFNTYNDGIIEENIGMMIMECLNDKSFDEIGWFEEEVDCLLNEQQSKINELYGENEQLQHEIEIEKKWQLEKDNYYVKIKEENEKLQKENGKLRQSVEYWQKKYEEGTETFQISDIRG